MRVLVPIDGSAYSDNSLAFIASRTTFLGRNPQIELFFASPFFSDENGTSFDVTNAIPEQVAEVFEPAMRIFGEKFSSLTLRCAKGEASHAIAEEAERFKADLIVMGTRGRGVLAGILFGSVTHDVLSLTKCPMLVLRDGSMPTQDDMHVGVAVDGSEFGEKICKFVADWSYFFGSCATIDLIHVMSTPDVPRMQKVSPEDLRQQELERFAEQMSDEIRIFQEAGLPHKYCPLTGFSGEAINDYAEKEELDILVMGTHGYGPIKSVLMGSTAKRLASLGSVPLLIMRQE